MLFSVGFDSPFSSFRSDNYFSTNCQVYTDISTIQWVLIYSVFCFRTNDITGELILTRLDV